MKAEICPGGGLQLIAETETELYAIDKFIENPGPVRGDTEEDFWGRRHAEYEFHRDNQVRAENELLRATVKSLLNGRDNTGDLCAVAGKEG
jgi:hypothetical protein